MSKKLKISKLLNTIILKNCKTVLFSSIDDIVFIKSDDVYVKVYNPKESELVTGSLKEIEKELPKNFIRSHKSYIINIKMINEINTTVPGKYCAVMRSGYKIPVTGKAYKKILAIFG